MIEESADKESLQITEYESIETSDSRGTRESMDEVLSTDAESEDIIIKDTEESEVGGSGEKESAETETDKKDDTYKLTLKAPVSIFDNPGYDYLFVQTIWEDGVYTIVEEAQDYEGNVWGRLKSGLGWIDLTKLENEQISKPPVKAGIIDSNMLTGDYIEVIVDDSEFSVNLIFIADGILTDARFTSMLPELDGYTEADLLASMDQITPEKPFVASVVFSGDFTTFGLNFVDENGKRRYYAAYVSGRNGELVLEEYEP